MRSIVGGDRRGEVEQIISVNIFRSIIAWIIGIFFLVVFFPVTFLVWLIVFPFDSNRRIIHYLLVWQSTILTYLMPVWKVQTEGKEKADSSATYVIISNHQSIIDILVINCLRYRYKWVSKIENTKLPFLGWYLRMAGYLVVDRSNDESKAELIANAYCTLKKGISVMFFPEGTRSLNGQPGFFKRGAFQLAIEAKVPILPIVVDGTGGLLPKNSLIFMGRNKIYLKVLAPVLPGSFGTDNPDTLALKFHELISTELSNLRNPDNAPPDLPKWGGADTKVPHLGDLGGKNPQSEIRK